jgi:hypothetical protein
VAEKICQQLHLNTQEHLKSLSDDTINASSLQAWHKKKLICICAAIRLGDVTKEKQVWQDRFGSSTQRTAALLEELKLLS